MENKPKSNLGRTIQWYGTTPVPVVNKICKYSYKIRNLKKTLKDKINKKLLPLGYSLGFKSTEKSPEMSDWPKHAMMFQPARQTFSLGLVKDKRAKPVPRFVAEANAKEARELVRKLNVKPVLDLRSKLIPSEVVSSLREDYQRGTKYTLRGTMSKTSFPDFGPMGTFIKKVCKIPSTSTLPSFPKDGLRKAVIDIVKPRVLNTVFHSPKKIDINLLRYCTYFGDGYFQITRKPSNSVLYKFVKTCQHIPNTLNWDPIKGEIRSRLACLRTPV